MMLRLCLVMMLLLPELALAREYRLFTQPLPPYVEVNGDSLEGLSIEIITELFNRANIPFRIEIMPWKRALFMVNQTNFSCLFPIQRNQDREADFHWVSPLYVERLGIYQLASAKTPLVNVRDLQGSVVGTYAGSATNQYLTSLQIKTEALDQEANNILMLKFGRIDYWATDILVAEHLIEQREIEGIQLGLEFFSSLRSLACHLNMPTEDLNALRTSLEDLFHDGTIDRLAKKYQKGTP
jgi:polar amino acid transport system substrate-binding protein